MVMVIEQLAGFILKELQNQVHLTKQQLDVLRGVIDGFREEARRQNKVLVLHKPKEKRGFMFFLKQRIEMQAKLDTMALTLKNRENEFELEMKKRDGEYAQRIKDREAEFNRTIATQQNDFRIKETNLKDELERTKKNFEESSKIKLEEQLSLSKLHSEQQIAKIQLEADKRVAEVENEKVKAIAALEKKNAEEISKVKQDEAQQHYTRMSEALTKMNSEGGVLTKNMHQLTMELLSHARPGVNETRFLTGRIDGQPGGDAKTIVTDGKTVNAAVVE